MHEIVSNVYAFSFHLQTYFLPSFHALFITAWPYAGSLAIWSISQLSVGGIHPRHVTRLWQGFTEIQLIMHSCGFNYRKSPSSSIYRRTSSPEPIEIGFLHFNLLCVTLEAAWSGKKTCEAVFGKNDNMFLFQQCKCFSQINWLFLL